MTRPAPAKLVTFLVVLAVAALSATVYVTGRAGEQAREKRAAIAEERRQPTLDAGAVRRAPHVVFRNTRPGNSYGTVALVPLTDPDGPRAPTDVECERVYATATAGFCLNADRGVVTKYHATLLDAALRPDREVPLAGGPSRARLAPDSRYAASTGFVAGHSYAETGFSTVTEIVDTGTGRSFGNLEEFDVIKDGSPYHSVDVNFWGVTFAADSSTFYASLGTHGTTYLLKGDLDRRELRTIRENAECPSLSPDGRRLVYKKRVSGGAFRWQLTALDLAAGTETALPETRSVDDQVAWLDNDHVLYAVPRDDGGASGPTDIWVTPLSGGQPELFIPDATSPAVVR